MFKRKAIAITASPSPSRKERKEYMEQISKVKTSQGGFEGAALFFMVEKKYSASLRKLFHAQCLKQTEDSVVFSDCNPAPDYNACTGGLDLHNAFYVSKDRQSLILCAVYNSGQKFHFSAKNICGFLSGSPKLDEMHIEEYAFIILSISSKKCPREVFLDLQRQMRGGVIKRSLAGVFNLLAMSIKRTISWTPLSFPYIGENFHYCQNRLDFHLLRWLEKKEYLQDLVRFPNIVNLSSVLFLTIGIMALGTKFITAWYRIFWNGNRNKILSIAVLCIGAITLSCCLFECWTMVSTILNFPVPEVVMTLITDVVSFSQKYINPCLNIASCISIVMPLLKLTYQIAKSGVSNLHRRISTEVNEVKRKLSAGRDRTESLVDPEAQKAAHETPEQSRSAPFFSAQELRVLEDSTESFVIKTLGNIGASTEETDKVSCIIRSVGKMQPYVLDPPLAVRNKGILLSALLALHDCGLSSTLKDQTDYLLGGTNRQPRRVISPSSSLTSSFSDFNVYPAVQFPSNVLFANRLIVLNGVIDGMTYFLDKDLTGEEQKSLNEDMSILAQNLSCELDWRSSELTL